MTKLLSVTSLEDLIKLKGGIMICSVLGQAGDSEAKVAQSLLLGFRQ